MGLTIKKETKKTYFELKGLSCIKVSFQEKQVISYLVKNLLWPLTLYLPLSLSLVTGSFAVLLVVAILLNESLTEKKEVESDKDEPYRVCMSHQ